MISNVYGVEDALVVVRLFAASLLAGSTSGYSAPNNATVVATMVSAVLANAQPSLPMRAAVTAAISATAATVTGAQVQPVPWAVCVHSRNVAPSTIAAPPSGNVSALARARTSPSVFSATNTAPWKAN